MPKGYDGLVSPCSAATLACFSVKKGSNMRPIFYAASRALACRLFNQHAKRQGRVTMIKQEREKWS